MPYYDDMPQSARHRRKRRSRRRGKLRGVMILAGLVLGVLVVTLGAIKLYGAAFAQEADDTGEMTQLAAPAAAEEKPPVAQTSEEPEPISAGYTLSRSKQTVTLNEEIQSEYALLVDRDSGEIIGEKNSESIINPASMTKILTLLVAAEQIEKTDGTFTMTREIADYCFSNECSVVGYEVGEEIPVIELFYGCILCSGADACLALTELACGSHEQFVELMNEKLQELGLWETAHFTNCVGVYDEEHFCSVGDMAKLMKAVLENDFCKEIMSTAVYMSVPTREHPEGQVLSNWFLRRIEDQDTGEMTVSCGKTGYVPESGHCAVSFGEDAGGKGYICVTGKGSSSWQVIYDHVYLYGMCETGADG